jgi:hypothetical protein
MTSLAFPWPLTSTGPECLEVWVACLPLFIILESRIQNACLISRCQAIMERQ